MKKISLILSFIIIAICAYSQTTKKPMDYDAFDSWKLISRQAISNDGNWVACKIEAAKGDAVVKAYNNKGEEKISFDCASDFRFSNDSRFLVVTISPSEDTVKALKLKKTKTEDMPLSKIGVYNLVTGSTQHIELLKSYKLPEKWDGWIAYQTQSKKAEKSTSPQEANNSSKKEKQSSDKNGYSLTIQNLNNQSVVIIPFVTHYEFAEENKCLVYITTGDDDSGTKPGVYRRPLEHNAATMIKEGSFEYKQLSISKDGKRVAFLMNDDEKNTTGNNYALWYWQDGGEVREIAAKKTPGLPQNWVISENHKPTFGEKTNRIFFGSSPAARQKDTTKLEEEFITVDVWHWQEGQLQTVQVVNRNSDLKRSYLAVYHAAQNKVVQLANPEIPSVAIIDDGDHDKALATTNIPYQLESMWKGRALLDAYLIDVNTGETSLVKKQLNGRPMVSPAFNYLYWYSASDSSWFSYKVATGKETQMTNPQTLTCYNELNDVPDYPSAYPSVGWTKDDNSFLACDRFDIWKIDPDNAVYPLNLTINGRTNNVSYNLVIFDRNQKYIDETASQILTGFNEVTKERGYYSVNLRRPTAPTPLLNGAFLLGTPIKAKDANAVIYSKERFDLFPDIILSDLSFKKSVKLTTANPQQKDYNWGTSELVKWISLDGKPLEGILIKPENFDPSKQYPMIVNFYERSSNGLHNHRTPEAHRSTIDYHYYSSNGYLIFNPDVVYKDGYPGESAYNCVMPGIMMLIEKGFVDKKRIGAQGHSWGGYQVAYLATRTDLFAAIESGAPVVNMFSAYGGIRWETGLNRSFQYEHQQSRVGASIWESPLRYLENSPLFTMDKVSTPILIMANDKDGHVPWYQGIEYFIALRRLGKPAWLLNYSGEVHWPLKYANKKDFQIRMSQFFNHYLKGAPMPEWMASGRPAVDKDFENGYD